jgi:hypothetical protein
MFETAAGGLEDVDSSKGAHGDFVDDENTRMAFARQARHRGKVRSHPGSRPSGFELKSENIDIRIEIGTGIIERWFGANFTRSFCGSHFTEVLDGKKASSRDAAGCHDERLR